MFNLAAARGDPVPLEKKIGDRLILSSTFILEGCAAKLRPIELRRPVKQQADSKIIRKDLADQFMITKLGKLALAAIEKQRETCKSVEVESAYQAYKKS